MITSMSELLCVTNRLLCREAFLTRIEKIAAVHPAGIVLREKDLPEAEYKKLASAVLKICRDHETPCILHSFVQVAIELGCTALHLPMTILRTIREEDRMLFTVLGASCHSVADAMEAERLGCTYITAGHVYDTDCKQGIPGRGLTFLKQVCESVSIPVYGIGGINADSMAAVRNTGAQGACIMSGVMMCEDVKQYLSLFEAGMS